MKVEFNPVFILHRRPYRETSLLLDIFSRDHGRLGLIAKGVRKTRNNKAELLQPYQPLHLSWSGKGELMNLVAVEAAGMAYHLRDRKMIAGFYINELIMRLLHKHEAHPELFDIYAQTLEYLNDMNSREQSVLRTFEKKLMEAVGYGLAIKTESDTGRSLDPDCTYYYQSDQGATTRQPEAGEFIRISGKALISLANEDYQSNDVLLEIKKLMRYVLSTHLGGKPLASRELYRAYIEQARVQK